MHGTAQWPQGVPEAGDISVVSYSGWCWLTPAPTLKQDLPWRAAWSVTGPGCIADYDAVLSEAGDYTEKYFKLRELLGSFSGTHWCRGVCPHKVSVS